MSRDPAAQPEIEPNYFADALDLDILVESMKFVQRVAAQPAWQAAAAAEVIPGPDSGIGEDEDKMRGESSSGLLGARGGWKGRLTAVGFQRSLGSRSRRRGVSLCVTLARANDG